MALRVTTTAQPNINTKVKKVSIPLVNLEELKNVNSSELDNGYTLIYDSVEEQWITQSPEELSLNLPNIDGGTY
jgi:hypothetical protein